MSGRYSHHRYIRASRKVAGAGDIGGRTMLIADGIYIGGGLVALILLIVIVVLVLR